MMRLELELSKLLHDSVFFSLPTDEISGIDVPVTCVSFMRVSIASRLSIATGGRR